MIVSFIAGISILFFPAIANSYISYLLLGEKHNLPSESEL